MIRLLFLILCLLAATSGVRGDDFDVGYAAQIRGEYEVAIKYYSKAIRSGTLPTDTLAHAYYNRGSTYSASGTYRLAIDDYNQVLALDPGYVFAYYNRGLTRFYLGEFADAVNDLGRALEHEPANPFRIIWLYVAKARAGQNARASLAGQATQLDLDAWPGPIVSLLLGQGSIQAVVDGARDSDTKRQTSKTCEAAFYVGQYMLIQGRDDEAGQWFDFAGATCTASFVEYEGTKVELARLTGKPQAKPLPKIFVATHDVNYRDGPSVEHKRIGAVAAGTSLTVDEQEGDWYRVQLDDGQHAFVHREFLQAAPDASSDKSEPVESTPTVAAVTSLEPLTYLASVNLSYREGPGTEHGRIGVVSEGAQLTVDGESGDWYRIRLDDGGHAFIYSDFVEPAAIQLAEADEVPATESTEVLTALDRPQQYVASANLSFRTGPGMKYRRLGVISDGSQVVVDARLNDWYRILLADGGRAFVFGDFLAPAGEPGSAPGMDSEMPADDTLALATPLDAGMDAVADSLVAAAAATRAEAGTDAAKPTTTGTGEAPLRPYRVITDVNYRSGPGTAHERLGGFAAGTRVMVEGESNGWLHVRLYDGSDAYVYRDFLEAEQFAGGEITATANDAVARVTPPDSADAGGYGSDASVSTAAGTGEEPIRPYRIITEVNYRAGPGTAHERLGGFAPGTRVMVEGESNGWLRVRLYDGSHAYVYRDFLEAEQSAGGDRLAGGTDPISVPPEATHVETTPPADNTVALATPADIATDDGAAGPATDATVSTAAGTDEEPLRPYRITTEVNYRSGPGTAHERLGGFAPGTRVMVEGESNGWLRLRLYDGSHAYVYRDFLEAEQSAGGDRLAGGTDPISVPSEATHVETTPPADNTVALATPADIATDAGAAGPAADAAVSTAAGTDEEPLRPYRITTEVNYRAGPGTAHERLGGFAPGTRVMVEGESNGWLRLRLRDGSLAYVYRDFLEPDSVSPADGLSASVQSGGSSPDDSSDPAVDPIADALADRVADPASVPVTAPDGEPRLYVTTDTVSYRDEPGAGRAPRGQLSAGSVVIVDGHSGEWSRLLLDDGSHAFVERNSLRRADASPPTASADDTAGAVEAYVARIAVNYRSGPSTEYPRLGAIPAGSRVTVDGRANDWYRIRLGDGTRAFIRQDLLSPADTPRGEAAYVATSDVNVRTGPGGSYAPLGSIAAGTRVEVVGQQNGWLKVRLYNGLQGYVYREFLRAETETGTGGDAGDTRPYVATENVSYREGPGREHRRLGGFRAGTRVQVDGEMAGWYRVIIGNTNHGFVHSDYLSPAQ